MWVSGVRARRGAFNWVTVFLVVVLLAIAFGAYAFVPMYYGEWTFRRVIQGEMIKAKERTDQEMMAEFNKVGGRVGVPTDGVQITRFNNEIRISYKYDRVIPILDKKMHFEDTLIRQMTDTQHLFHQNK
ncbi:MAG: hypothetical protein H6684_05450 [Deltaproteobacteria bacterium]|nr:hypothetical protein [Deltaproteobacteria bacterium]MCB9479094.1 hypothetical protein [Deltaproteobacteria bacterium]MCB9488156.1 hypothetical protein [Deltaproteobacteria bacterium]